MRLFSIKYKDVLLTDIYVNNTEFTECHTARTFKSMK